MILAVQTFIRTAQGRLTAFLGRIGADVRGNVAMMFAFAAPVLIMMTLGAVDIHRISTVKANVQDALDAATLAAARSSFTTEADLTRVGLATLKANLAGYPGITLKEDETRFYVDANEVVIADARVDVKTLVANIVMPPYGQLLDDTLPVSGHSEVNRSSRDLEVALVLDITGSMSNGKIEALKSAALELVDIVVQPVQTPYYSKMAIIPYSSGVNLGSYVAKARGTPTGSVNITAANWIATSATAKTITGITRAAPGVVTASNHGLATGDFVWIGGVRGMTQINDEAYRVRKISNNTFSLEYRSGSNWYNLNTRSQDGYGAYNTPNNGTVTKCQREGCTVLITANGHGLSSGDGVYINEVRGLTSINKSPYWVTRVNDNQYTIAANVTSSAYSGGGKSWCGQYGCAWRVFTAMTGETRAFKTTSCVSERTGAERYSDASPGTAKVGHFYGLVDSNENDNSSCPSDAIQPLTSTKKTLTDLIDDLTIGGGTAGQIGTAWGWYAVSPSFNSLWPGSEAGEYDPELLKAVILMTDGEFNTPYATGVVARDAGASSGANNLKINQNATNGSPFSQAVALCAGMKAKGIVVYTVGFQVPANGAAAEVMRDCATTTDHAYLPTSNTDLSQAFRDIGRDITRLRISK